LLPPQPEQQPVWAGGGDTEPGRPTRPWYRRWWGLALIVFGVIVVIGALTDQADNSTDVESVAAEPEPEPEPTEEAPEPEAAAVAVPDFRGSYVSALEAADEADLELRTVDEQGNYQAIFSRDNWEVEAQSVEPDVNVDPGTEVEVTVYRPIDREREEERQQRDTEREQERQQRDTEREQERQQRDTEREQERQQREAERRDWNAEYQAEWGDSFGDVVGTIEESGGTIRVHFLHGDATGPDGTATLDGDTYHSVAMSMCMWLQHEGWDGHVDVLDPAGMAFVRTTPFEKLCKTR
jgi:hypothetical protein